jgi:hypothetical protein
MASNLTLPEGSHPMTIWRIAFKIDKVVYLLSFLIPLAVRSIPELLSPVPIGFDTVIYLVQAKNLSSKPAILPFFSKILSIFYSFGVDLIVLMKILPPLFFATTVFLAGMYARKRLGWSWRNTLILIIIMTFSAAMLRMSWDLHRQSAATILLLAYLCMDPWKDLTTKKVVTSFILIMFIGLLHELVLVTVIAINFYLALLALRKKMFKRGLIFIILAITPVICYEVGAYVTYSRPIDPTGVFVDLSGEWSGKYANLVSYEVGILVATFWYVLPLAPLGYFYDRYFTPWMLVMLVGFLSQILTPFFAVRLGDRWMLYMAIPLMFYASNALSRLNGSRRFRTVAIIFTLIIVCMNGFSMLGVVQPVKLPSNLYIGFIPSTMVFSTAKPEHVTAIISLSQVINNVAHKNACIVTHDPWFSYWVRYLTNLELYSFSGNSPDPAVSKAVSRGCGEVYVIWFKGQVAGGEILSEGDQIALYRISPTKTLRQ